MVNKCAAINCRSGYAKEKKDSNITFHIFSFNDEKLLKQWVETNCKKKFNPSKNARICFLHFKAEDFVFDFADQQDRRKRKGGTIKLVKRRLKDFVCPSIFNNLPAYYSYKSIPACSGVASCSSRHENAASKLEEQCNTFFKCR